MPRKHRGVYTYELVVSVSPRDEHDEKFEISLIKDSIEAYNVDTDIAQIHIVSEPRFVNPLRSSEDTTELDKLSVPLSDLRMEIVQLLKEGFSEAPLGQFMLIVRNLIRNANGEGV